MLQMIPQNQDTGLRDLVGQAVRAIEDKTGREVTGNRLRCRLGRVLRRATLEEVLAAIDSAPAGYGPPLVVRWCEKRTAAPPSPAEASAADPLAAIVEQLVEVLEGRPSDQITGTLHPCLNATTGVVVGLVAFNAIRRARFSGPEDDVTNRLRTLHTLTSISLEATSSTATIVEQAVAVGASWEQIGSALGVGEVAARIRYER